MKTTLVQQDQKEGLQKKPFPFLLESALEDQRTGISSYRGADPCLVLTAKGNNLTLWEGGKEKSWKGDPFETLQEILEKENLLAVGWLGYELNQAIEVLPSTRKDDLGFPDLFLAFHDQYQYRSGQDPEWETIRTDTTGRPRAISQQDYQNLFRSATRPPLSRNFSKEEYLSAVRVAKEYIQAGDIYQVNLSQRFETTGPDPWDVYDQLKKASPAPYSAILQIGDKTVLSSSPEQFLRVHKSEIITRPIKGTRPRMPDPVEDLKMGRELYSSRKDDAELAMIVDLERNDLGRICKAGSVHVQEAKEQEIHPTVHHLSSTIRGTLKEEAGCADILRATFPGGSITGAPKIRAMEIIDELEPTHRGVYTGAIGVLGPEREMNLSIAIRVLHYENGRYSFQVGGAIVADSDPESEYQETLVKATGMAEALGMKWNTSL